MFFSKVLLFAISLGAISVLATPHALHHHALHRRAVAARAVAARVASPASNSSNITVKRQNSAKCIDRSSNPSSSPSIPSPSIPATTPNVQHNPPVAPPVTTPTPTPTPTPTHAPNQQPTTTSSSAPPPSTQPPSTGGGGGDFTDGDGTFFATGLGACGITNVDTDYIVAVSKDRFDAESTGNSNTNPLCGRKVSISFGGASAIATIVDRCVGCAINSLDMTTSLFQVFAPLSVGRIHGLRWRFI